MRSQIDGDHRPSYSVRDMFPQTNVERVQELLGHEIFQALVALDAALQLASILQEQLAEQEMMKQLQRALQISYGPSKQSLYALLEGKGYTQSELSAAKMVADGILLLTKERE